MKSKKLGTMFLSMLLVFTLIIAVGCGKDDEEQKPDGSNTPTPTEKDKDKDNGKKGGSSNTKKTVKLLMELNGKKIPRLIQNVELRVIK